MLVIILALLVPFIVIIFTIGFGGFILHALKTAKKDENTALPYLLGAYAIFLAVLIATGQTVYATLN